MFTIPYDASRASLYHPGAATDFFQYGLPPTEAALCAEMSRLAYVKAPDRLASYLARADFVLQETFGYGKSGTQAFIATSTAPGGQAIVLAAFRGTEGDDFSDLRADAQCLTTLWQGGQGGRVHAGFAAAWSEHDVVAALHQHLACQLRPRLLLTGHSLGAALATLTASAISPDYLYTFGSPRVGDQAFAATLRGIAHDRYVDCCDLVTQVPPAGLLGYTHIGSLHYINKKGQVWVAPDKPAIRHDRLLATAHYWLHYAILPHTVWMRRLADHAPINYVSGVMGVRGGVTESKQFG